MIRIVVETQEEEEAVLRAHASGFSLLYPGSAYQICKRDRAGVMRPIAGGGSTNSVIFAGSTGSAVEAGGGGGTSVATVHTWAED